MRTPWSPHSTWFPLRSRHQGTTGSSSGVMMPKSPKLASFPRVVLPARARPMAHRIEGRTWDLYLIAHNEIKSRLLMGIEIWGRQLTTRGADIGVSKRGSFRLLEMSQNSGYSNGIPPRRLGDRICHSICDPPGGQRRLPCPWLSKIFMPLGVVTIQIGSTIAKMAKSSTLTLG